MSLDFFSQKVKVKACQNRKLGKLGLRLTNSPGVPPGIKGNGSINRYLWGRTCERKRAEFLSPAEWWGGIIALILMRPVSNIII